MANSLRQFINRAPRYILNADDNRLLRVVRDGTLHKIITSELINISETGLIFSVDRQVAPRIGEMIKVEFATTLAEEGFAWFARVMRIELPEEQFSWKNRSTTVRVGIRFEKLPAGHADRLRRQLNEKFEQLRNERRLRLARQSRAWMADHGLQLAIYVFATLATVAILYILSRPSANYDPKNPSVWGERFK